MPATTKRRTLVKNTNAKFDQDMFSTKDSIINHRRMLSDQLPLIKIKTVRIIQKKDIGTRTYKRHYTLNLQYTQKELNIHQSALKGASSHLFNHISPIASNLQMKKGEMVDDSLINDDTFLSLIKELGQINS